MDAGIPIIRYSGTVRQCCRAAVLLWVDNNNQFI